MCRIGYPRCVEGSETVYMQRSTARGRRRPCKGNGRESRQARYSALSTREKSRAVIRILLREKQSQGHKVVSTKKVLSGQP